MTLTLYRTTIGISDISYIFNYSKLLPFIISYSINLSFQYIMLTLLNSLINIYLFYSNPIEIEILSIERVTTLEVSGSTTQIVTELT